MTNFELLKQVDVKTFSSLVHAHANSHTEQEFLEMLNREVPEDALQQLSAIAQVENRQKITFTPEYSDGLCENAQKVNNP